MIHVMQTECGMNCGTTLSPFIKDDSLHPLDRRSYEGSTEASFLKKTLTSCYYFRVR